MPEVPAPKFLGVYTTSPGAKHDQNPRWGRECPLQQKYITGKLHDLKVGDVVRRIIVPSYGGHGASMIITKINKSTFAAIEIKGSYNQGRPWRVHDRAVGSWVICEEYISEERLLELSSKWDV